MIPFAVYGYIFAIPFLAWGTVYFGKKIKNKWPDFFESKVLKRPANKIAPWFFGFVFTFILFQIATILFWVMKLIGDPPSV